MMSLYSVIMSDSLLEYCASRLEGDSFKCNTFLGVATVTEKHTLRRELNTHSYLEFDLSFSISCY